MVLHVGIIYPAHDILPLNNISLAAAGYASVGSIVLDALGIY
jgi:hypothetical protein